MNVIYEDTAFTDYDEREIVFDELFDNSYEKKSYVLTGDIQLWDGVRKNVHHPKICKSIAEAIITANAGFGGYITVSEGSYGKLFVRIGHHDGVNSLEIRELTKIGEEMNNSYKDVGEILKRKGATRNVRFLKRRG